MARSPFVLCVRDTKSGPIWYARFYDPENQNRYIVRSTGVPHTNRKGHNRQVAHDAARAMFDSVFTRKADPFFLDYVSAFWNPDSPYLKRKRLADKKPLSRFYVQQNQDGIRLHVAPFMRFKKTRLSQLTAGMIEDWKLDRLENGMGARRLNAVLQSIRIPIRYAFERQEIPHDPFLHVKPVPYTAKEKGVLNRDELRTVLSVEDGDPRIILSIQLAALCGLRRGEVRGLLWNDIDLAENLIQIRHNYIDGEGIKACKWGSERTAILPQSMITTIMTVRNCSPFTDPNDFVIFGIASRTNPVGNTFIRAGFSRMLNKAGISPDTQRMRNLTYHGLRHTFVSLARAAGIPDIIVQSLAGHKSAEMMNHYSHGSQVIDFADTRKRLEAIETDGKEVAR